MFTLPDGYYLEVALSDNYHKDHTGIVIETIQPTYSDRKRTEAMFSVLCEDNFVRLTPQHECRVVGRVEVVASLGERKRQLPVRRLVTIRDAKS